MACDLYCCQFGRFPRVALIATQKEGMKINVNKCRLFLKFSSVEKIFFQHGNHQALFLLSCVLNCALLAIQYSLFSVQKNKKSEVFSYFWKVEREFLLAVAQPAQKFGEAKMFDFRQITLFCLEKRFSKIKWLYFLKIWEGAWPVWPPWLRLCLLIQFLWTKGF